MSRRKYAFQVFLSRSYEPVSVIVEADSEKEACEKAQEEAWEIDLSHLDYDNGCEVELSWGKMIPWTNEFVKLAKSSIMGMTVHTFAAHYVISGVRLDEEQPMFTLSGFRQEVSAEKLFAEFHGPHGIILGFDPDKPPLERIHLEVQESTGGMYIITDSDTHVASVFGKRGSICGALANMMAKAPDMVGRALDLLDQMDKRKDLTQDEIDRVVALRSVINEIKQG